MSAVYQVRRKQYKKSDDVTVLFVKVVTESRAFTTMPQVHYHLYVTDTRKP